MTPRNLAGLLAVALHLVILGMTSAAAAYETRIAVRTTRAPTDDGVLITVPNVSLANGGIIYDPAIPGNPRIYMIANSVGFCLQTTNPRLVATAYFTSLDPIHDTVPSVADRCLTAPAQTDPRSYDFKLYITNDMLWVEAKRSGALIAPTLSTVFFISPIRDVNDVTGGLYFKSQELKDDVQKNYADRYNPVNVGLIEYTPAAIAAAVRMTTVHP